MKRCKKCEREYPYLWSKGLCYYCTPKKPIKKVGKETKKKLADWKNIKKLDQEFYMRIWLNRRHNCEHCHIFLGNEPLTIFFDHILEKSKYPQFRHNPENIWLLCWQCHTNKTNGTYSESMSRKIKEVRDKLIDEQNETTE